MDKIPHILAIIAVILFAGSYLIKERKWLIFCNAVSRVFYVLQYILLGQLDGAVMDVVACLVSFLAQKKETDRIRRHAKLIITLANAAIILAGLVVYKNPWTLVAIAAVLFETGALWLSKEKHIRIVSFFGAPLWLAYNLNIGSYAAIGNILTILTIGFSILRYDIIKTKKEP